MPKSQTIKEIVNIINCEEGLKEAILTAVNTEAFGKDTGETLEQLVSTILNKTMIKRLSFGSIHPLSITKTFLSLYSNAAYADLLVRFFHVPIQSGSDKVLQSMKRGYTVNELQERLDIIEKNCNLPLIGTDIIVGFFNETDKEFEETVHFLEKSPINKFHVFRYSRREHTEAIKLFNNEKEPTESEKKKRAKTLIEFGNKKYFNFLNKNVGRISPALFLEREENGYQEALIDNQLPVYVKTSKNRMGEILNVKITDLKDGKLLASVIPTK